MGPAVVDIGATVVVSDDALVDDGAMVAGVVDVAGATDGAVPLGDEVGEGGLVGGTSFDADDSLYTPRPKVAAMSTSLLGS